jgi:hypothetical protein
VQINSCLMTLLVRELGESSRVACQEGTAAGHKWRLATDEQPRTAEANKQLTPSSQVTQTRYPVTAVSGFSDYVDENMYNICECLPEQNTQRPLERVGPFRVTGAL